MDVPPNLTQSVCFLCVEQNGRYVPKATAFFISVPADFGVANAGYVYLATAKHCVEQARLYGPLFARLNLKVGSVQYHKIETEWFYNDDEGSDAAILPFHVPEAVEFVAVPIAMCATDEIIQEKRIGIGDDIVVTGLFTGYAGKTQNSPILRGGMISAMPKEALVGKGGEEYRAYLLEMRSTGGLSGSPVFVVKSWFTDPKHKTKNLGLQLFSYVFFLIGVIRGHWEREDVGSYVGENTASEPINMGIAIATPIQESLRILLGSDLAKERRRSDVELRRKGTSSD
jgi:hypothetical protein